MSAPHRVLAWCLLLVAATVSTGRAAEPEVEPKAQKVIDAFGKYYGQLKSLSFQANISLIVEQGEQRQEVAVEQKFAAERPNKFSFHSQSPQGSALIISDGSQLAAYIKGLPKYGVEKVPATFRKLLENQIVLGALSFGNGTPITAAILSDDPAKKLIEQCTAVKYGGLVKLDDMKCHLIKTEGANLDWQVWIDAGDKPLVRRFVPDAGKLLAAVAKQQGGAPPANLKITNVITYSDWELDPKLDVATFAFKAPEGVAKAKSLVEMLGGLGAPTGPSPLLGKAAPAADLELLDGGKLDLTSFKNKNVVILDFWATWCGPCTEALPKIEKVAEQYKKKGVRLFAVNIAEDADTIKKFLDAAELKVNVALDSKGDTAKAYLASAIPQTVLVGKDGTVQVVHVGATPDLEEQLAKEIDDLLAGKDLAAETLAEAKAGSDDEDDQKADESKAAPEETKAPAPAKTPAAKPGKK